jgi:hypothetical protein
MFVNNLGFLLYSNRRYAEAEPLWVASLSGRRRVLGFGHPDSLQSVINLGSLFEHQGKYLDAIDLLTPDEVATRRTFTGASARKLVAYLAVLGRSRAGLGYDADRFRLAETNLREAHDISVDIRDGGPTHKDTLECVQALVDLYSTWHTAEPGQGYDAKAAEWQAKLPPKDDSASPGGPK